MADREQKRRKLNSDSNSHTPTAGPSHYHGPKARPPLNASASFPSPSLPHGHFRETARSPKATHKPLPPIFTPTERHSSSTPGSLNEDQKSHETGGGASDYRTNLPVRPRLVSHGSGESVPSIVEPGDEIKVDGYRDGEHDLFAG